MEVLTLILIFAVFGLSATIYALYKKYSKLQNQQTFSFSEKEAIDKAEEIAKARIQTAKTSVKHEEEQSERIIQAKKDFLKNKEDFLKEKEQVIEQRENNSKEVEENIIKRKELLNTDKQNLEKKQREYLEKLYKIAGISDSNFETQVQAEIEQDVRNFANQKIERLTNFYLNNVESSAKRILESIIQIQTSEPIGDSSSAHISYSNQENYNLIRNSEKLQNLLNDIVGIELNFDDEFNEITVSCLDPIRREVGVRVIKDLENMKKIDSEIIQELVKKNKEKLLKEVKEAGEFAAKEAGFPYLPEKIKLMLGKGKFRFSYGQNLLEHHLEVAKLAERAAKYFGADRQKSKLAAFLHDIGKVVSEDDGTPHHHISAKIYKEFYPDDEVVYNAIIAHHFDVDAKYPEALVVRLVDAISGARPGARRQSAEEYFEKIRQLEEIAGKHKGVDHAFAIRAGREVRIFVNPKQVNDAEIIEIADSVAKEIEETMGYPGSIKVNVIRETIAVENANQKG
ncbi:MAG: ribonuclease Y [Candidatus Dojkabacteria bacterium]